MTKETSAWLDTHWNVGRLSPELFALYWEGQESAESWEIFVRLCFGLICNESRKTTPYKMETPRLDSHIMWYSTHKQGSQLHELLTLGEITSRKGHTR